MELIATGEIRSGVDPDLVLDMINGAMLYRALMAGRLDDAVADEIADLVTRAIGADTSRASRGPREPGPQTLGRRAVEAREPS